MDPLSIALMLAGKFAPDIIKHFTHSDTAGAVADKVIDLAKTVTGQDTPEAAQLALTTDPALALQFKTAVMAHDLELAKIALAETQAYLADKQGARTRDVAYVQAGRYNYRADILAILAVGGLVFCVYLVATNAGLEERAVNAIMFVAGVLASAVRDVFSFEFGSSRGSKEKDEMIIRNLRR